MFFKEEELETKRIDSNTFRRVLAYGEGLMNALITFEKGLNPETEIPYHSHEHVQTTYVLKGSFKFSIKYTNQFLNLAHFSSILKLFSSIYQVSTYCNNHYDTYCR